jgi:hypothetical protein
VVGGIIESKVGYRGVVLMPKLLRGEFTDPLCIASLNEKKSKSLLSYLPLYCLEHSQFAIRILDCPILPIVLYTLLHNVHPRNTTLDRLQDKLR